MTQVRAALLCAGLLSLLAPGVVAAQQTAIQIHADLTDTRRMLFHAEIDLPVHQGRLDLITPEWLPGAHGPRGPVSQIAGLRFEADSKALPWRRDAVDVYEYHLEVPAGVSTLHAHLDYFCIYNTTNSWAVLGWEGLLLYPAHVPVRDIAVQATVTVPEGWGVGTSLTPVKPLDQQHPTGGTIKYAPTTVELLQDSPVMTGRYFHEYVLADGTSPRHFLDVVGPSAASVNVGSETIEQMSHLVRESFAMFGPPHYAAYHFLVLLKAGDDAGGLEHHESSDSVVPLSFFQSSTPDVDVSGLLTHEFTHSWNGKFRRPDGLATQDFATPMRNDLLWVYEGLTDYLGAVMAERIGAMSAEEYREELAVVAARQEAQSGRAWRSVEDTTFTSAMPRNGSRGPEWMNWKRGTDYYDEGSLFWLDVDTTIRRLTKNTKSLRDFLLLFLQKGQTGVVRVEPYTLADVERDLNQIVPHDWAAFIQVRLYDVQPHVNLEGIEQGGWRLEYTSTPTPDFAKVIARQPSLNTWFSIGLDVARDGSINDVQVGGAAEKAGLVPGDKIVFVNGMIFSMDRLTEAIKDLVPLQLQLREADDSVMNRALPYTGGPKYPRLTRVASTPDLLSNILTPVTSP